VWLRQTLSVDACCLQLQLCCTRQQVLHQLQQERLAVLQHQLLQ
jgi:hypothetical protein